MRKTFKRCLTWVTMRSVKSSGNPRAGARRIIASSLLPTPNSPGTRYAPPATLALERGPGQGCGGQRRTPSPLGSLSALWLRGPELLLSYQLLLFNLRIWWPFPSFLASQPLNCPATKIISVSLSLCQIHTHTYTHTPLGKQPLYTHTHTQTHTPRLGKQPLFPVPW